MDIISSNFIDKLNEGIKNLKGRTDFQILRHHDQVWEIEQILERLKKSPNQDLLDHLRDIYLKTSFNLEGDNSFDSSIWNAKVQIKSEITTLEIVLGEIL